MVDSLRVLHLIKGLGPGGAEQLLLQQARARDRARFDYHIAYLVAEKDQLVPDLSRTGATIHRLDGRAWARRLRHLLEDLDIDVVHVHSPLPAAALRLATLTLDRRPALVTTEHNRWPRHHRLTRMANRITLPLDDHTLAVSADVRATMPGRAAVEVLLHGIDTAAVAAQRAHRATMREKLALTADTLAIGHVANFRPEKAHDVALDAAAIACAADDRLRVLLVGQGPLAADVAARRDRLGLQGRVELLGYRADATRVLAACDVFTLSSRHEGLPVALMEAMALRLPIAATRAGGVPQAVAHEREALLVPIDDPDALAAAWLRLAADDDLRRQLGEAAGERAPSFDVTRSVQRLETIYDDLHRTRSGAAGYRGERASSSA